MVRALHRSIFGKKAGASFCSMSVQRTPRLPRSTASVSPTGPAPTIRTCVSGMHSLATDRAALAPWSTAPALHIHTRLPRKGLLKRASAAAGARSSAAARCHVKNFPGKNFPGLPPADGQNTTAGSSDALAHSPGYAIDTAAVAELRAPDHTSSIALGK